MGVILIKHQAKMKVVLVLSIGVALAASFTVKSRAGSDDDYSGDYSGGSDYDMRFGSDYSGSDYDMRFGSDYSGSDHDMRFGSDYSGSDYDMRSGSDFSGSDRSGSDFSGSDYYYYGSGFDYSGD